MVPHIPGDIPGASDGDEEAAGSTASADLPLFRPTLSAEQVKDVKSAIGELSDLRDRLRKALDAVKKARN